MRFHVSEMYVEEMNSIHLWICGFHLSFPSSRGGHKEFFGSRIGSHLFQWCCILSPSTCPYLFHCQNHLYFNISSKVTQNFDEILIFIYIPLRMYPSASYNVRKMHERNLISCVHKCESKMHYGINMRSVLFVHSYKSFVNVCLFE